MVVLAMILPIASMLPWKRSNLQRTMVPLWGIAALSVALGAAVWVMQTGGRMLAPVGLTLAFWVVVGAMADVAVRVKLGKAKLSESLRRAVNLPRADWGKMFSHVGFGLMIFGISAIMTWEVEDIRTVKLAKHIPFKHMKYVSMVSKVFRGQTIPLRVVNSPCSRMALKSRSCTPKNVIIQFRACQQPKPRLIRVCCVMFTWF